MSAVSKLLIRHLRRYYQYVSQRDDGMFEHCSSSSQNSVYARFSFSTPQKMKDNLTKQGIADRYIFDRPTAAPIPKILEEFAPIKHVMNDPVVFPPMYELRVVQDGQEFMLSIEPGSE